MGKLLENKGSAFRQLQVWQKSMDIVENVYSIARSLPQEEQFAMASQIRRCSISVPSNIAEGSKRGGGKTLLASYGLQMDQQLS